MKHTGRKQKKRITCNICVAFLCIALLAGSFACLTLATLPVMAENKGTTGVTGTLDYDMAYRIFELVNAERAKAGVPALKLDADLQSAGMLRAAEISYKFEHIRPNGKICYSISSKVYAENICMNKGHADPAAKAMDIWMGSKAGHRDNILDPDFTIIGVGTFIASDGSYYFTQEFGYDAAKGSPVLSGEVTTTIAIDLGEPEIEPATTATTTAQTTTAPTTTAPTTVAPTTVAPTTAVPTTAVPTTAVPTTAVPTTAVPTTEAPTTAVPTTDAPAVTAPATTGPGPSAPGTAEPGTSEADFAEPTAPEPLTSSGTVAALLVSPVLDSYEKSHVFTSDDFIVTAIMEDGSIRHPNDELEISDTYSVSEPGTMLKIVSYLDAEVTVSIPISEEGSSVPAETTRLDRDSLPDIEFYFPGDRIPAGSEGSSVSIDNFVPLLTDYGDPPISFGLAYGYYNSFQSTPSLRFAIAYGEHVKKICIISADELSPFFSLGYRVDDYLYSRSYVCPEYDYPVEIIDSIFETETYTSFLGKTSSNVLGWYIYDSEGLRLIDLDALHRFPINNDPETAAETTPATAYSDPAIETASDEYVTSSADVSAPDAFSPIKSNEKGGSSLIIVLIIAVSITGALLLAVLILLILLLKRKKAADKNTDAPAESEPGSSGTSNDLLKDTPKSELSSDINADFDKKRPDFPPEEDSVWAPPADMGKDQ